MTDLINIIIPSKKQEKQIEFLTRAIASVRKQNTPEKSKLLITIAVDRDCELEQSTLDKLGVQCVVSKGSTQATALNTAIDKVKDGYVAFLEDDDQWEQNYLHIASKYQKHFDFISSTQAEYNEKGIFIRINDFPTPSGWFMPTETLHRVGKFNEEYKFHLDNEWLGRLKQKSVKRVHLTEATAPINKRYCKQVRPWLANVINFSEGLCVLGRHTSPYPLVRRLVHKNSGMANIARDPNLWQISQTEQKRLRETFGAIPW